MKNVFKGGLMSLIPNREVEDPDEVMDFMEEEDEEEEVPAIESVPEVKTESETEKKVSVVSEDQTDAEEAEEIEDDEIDEEVEEEEQEELEEDDEALDQPSSSPDGEGIRPARKPLVTPIEIDTEPEKVEEETLTPKTKAKVKKPDKVEKKVKAIVKNEVKEEKLEVDMWNKHEKDVHHVPVELISVNPNQPRRKFNQVEMDELIESIAMHGVLQPLVVRRFNKKYELVAGERRLRAVKSLGWEKVPCVIRVGVKSGASRLELALIENIQREDLNPVEEAMAYKRLNEEYGMTHEEVGERVGRSRVGITNAIRVLQLPEEVQRGLTDGKISSGHARAILMIPDNEKQVRFYRHLLEEGLTVRKAETRARRIQRTMGLDSEPMRLKRKGRSAFEIKNSGLLEDRFGYDAKVRFDSYKNRFEVQFRCHSQEQINELIGRLMGTEPLPEGEDKDVIESKGSRA